MDTSDSDACPGHVGRREVQAPDFWVGRYFLPTGLCTIGNTPEGQPTNDKCAAPVP